MIDMYLCISTLARTLNVVVIPTCHLVGRLPICVLIAKVSPMRRCLLIPSADVFRVIIFIDPRVFLVFEMSLMLQAVPQISQSAGIARYYS